jgi:uncharacterized protein YggE
MARGRTVLLAAALAVFALLLGIALGRSGRDDRDSGATPRAITVNGTGTVSSVPHEADFTLGVSATAKSASAATSANAAKMTQVIAVLKSNGVAAADIQTAQISLSPNENEAGTKVIDYTVTNSVTVDIRNLGKAGSIIDAAVGAGANQVDGPTLTPTGQKEIYRAALKAAIADAQARAEAIAAAAGEKLGTLQSASETSTAPIAFNAAKSDVAAAATPIEPGTVQTEADVTATYNLG